MVFHEQFVHVQRLWVTKLLQCVTYIYETVVTGIKTVDNVLTNVHVKNNACKLKFVI